MKPILPPKVLAAIGLVLISGSFILKYYLVVPDFIDGFLKGLGLAIIILIVIWKLKARHANN